MASTPLMEFERPIFDLEKQIDELKKLAGDQQFSVEAEIAPLERKLNDLRAEVYKNLSPLRYAQPFHFGYIGVTHLFILMFDRIEGIRFSHSPSSGGPPSSPNPAWDFQFIIPKYDVLEEYSYRARVVYRSRQSSFNPHFFRNETKRGRG